MPGRVKHRGQGPLFFIFFVVFVFTLGLLGIYTLAFAIAPTAVNP